MTDPVDELPETLPGGLPPLTELLAWTTDHLIDGAAYLEQTAELWEHTTTSIWRDVHMIGWDGQTADAARGELTGLKTEAADGGERLRNSAREARTGAGDVLPAQNALGYAVAAAQEAGFIVYDDYAVEDPTGENPAGAQAAADTIYQRAKELVGVDTHVGDRIRQEVGDLDRLFDEPVGSDGPQVQLVDNKAPKAPQFPLPLDPLHPPPGWPNDRPWFPDPTHPEIVYLPHPPPGKEWHLYGTGVWVLEDPLKQCSAGTEFWDIARVGGGLITMIFAPGLPGKVVGFITAGGAMHDLSLCAPP